MKTKLMILTFLLLSLSGCTLATPEVPILNQEIEPFPIGIYVVMNDELTPNDPAFDINDTNQTFYIRENHIGENNETYNYSRISGQFIESHTHIEVSEDEEKIILNASLPTFSDVPQYFRFYAIYKDKNDHYFTQPSNTFLFTFGGAVKLEFSTTEVLNGVSKKKTMVFDIAVKSIDPLQTLRVIMMGADYEVIDSMTITSESEILLNKDVIYALIEETRINSDDEEIKTLTMIETKSLSQSPYMHTIITSSKHPRGIIYTLKLYTESE